MLYLFNNQVGYATDEIGFPSVQGCNAIVYATPAGMCGYHSYGGATLNSEQDTVTGRAVEFANWAQQCNMLHRGTQSTLYSVINDRYDVNQPEQLAMWKKEMRAFAKALGMAGTIRLVALVKHLEKGNSVYIEYDKPANSDVCRMFYKKWSKMAGKKISTVPDNMAQIKKGAVETKKSGFMYRKKTVYTNYDLVTPNLEYEEVYGYVYSKGGMMHNVNGEDGANALQFTVEV